MPPLSENHVTKSLGKTFPLHPPKCLMNFILVIDCIPGCKFPIRGHAFMTSTRRGPGSGGRMWTGEGDQARCGRPHRKLKLESMTSSCFLLMQRSWYIFLPECLLWTEYKVEIFRRYKLVIINY